ncbi:hypothetical protein [Streptomyces sp. NPDC093109]|uniref:hypothetical protein n=1 Tax=Streptomyces sp. NPDC093109 TaxID=3154977 RepID=UPI00344E60F4
MVSGNRFEADLSLLDALMRKTAEVGKEMRGAAQEYQDGISETRNWFGLTDEYARETGPDTERSQEQFTVGPLAAADTFDGLSMALGEAKYEITGASNWANDEIGLGQDGMDDFGNGTGGRH